MKKNISKISWTNDNIDILKNVYTTGGTKAVQTLITGATKASIQLAAQKNGISNDKSYRFGNKLTPLTYDNNISYYWMGFLMADGHFDLKNGKNLNVGISIKDEEHLKKLANLLTCSIYYRKVTDFNNYKCSDLCYINVRDSKNLPILINKFKIKNNKTYNPPDISCLDTKEKFLSFFVGFVDGDGSIVKQKKGELAMVLSIQCHKNWISIFEIFNKQLELLFNIKSKHYIDTTGFAKIQIFRFNQLKQIKIEMLKLNIPFLERKWNNINESLYCSKFLNSEHKNTFIKLYNENVLIKDICIELKISSSKAKSLIKEFNLPRRQQKWSIENIKLVASSYDSKLQFKKGCYNGYQSAVRMKILHELFKNKK